ncbi:MAG: nucleotide exchange factor GrpE [Tidjanibacter sp.]|nr:nucleotide exchange factor GrpE [Tidjanibacter sp.]
MNKKTKAAERPEKEIVVDNADLHETDAYPNCEGSPCDNLAGENEEKSDNSDKVAEPASAEIERLTAEAADWKDRYLRLSAEFDNYRKRTLKEKMDLIESGGEDVIKAMLTVVDDLDRALAAMDATHDMTSIKDGVKLIAQKMCDQLRAKGVSEIEAVGHEMNTDLYEAVAKFPVEPERKGKIIDVVQKGYKLKDKVIRYAKVVVGE